MELTSLFLNAIFPRTCVGCQIYLPHDQETFLCSTCAGLIPRVHDFSCAFCKAPVSKGQTCPFCRKDHGLDSLVVIADYKHRLVETMLKQLKYRFLKALSNDMAQIMFEYIKEKKKVILSQPLSEYVLTAVPLHRLRYNWRGFNQSEEIARALSGLLKIEFRSGILEKTKHLKPQADIPDRLERIRNIESAFSNGDQISAVTNKHVLLIDDVCTTGATLDACACIIKKAGASHVTGLVFARGQ